MPVSSSTSRATPSAGVSDSSRTPPGGTQRPSSDRWIASTRPSSRNTIPVTLTEWRGSSPTDPPLLCCPLVGQPPLLAGEDVDDRLHWQVVFGVGDAGDLQHVLGLGKPQEVCFFGPRVACLDLLDEPRNGVSPGCQPLVQAGRAGVRESDVLAARYR